MTGSNLAIRSDISRAATYVIRSCEKEALIIQHTSGHFWAGDRKALEVSGVTRDTPDPEGGLIRAVRSLPTIA